MPAEPAVQEESATACYRRGLDYASSMDDEKAIEEFSRAIELDASMTGAYYNRGSAYHRLLDYDRAVTDYTKAIEVRGATIRCYYRRGQCLDKLGRCEEAIEDFERFIELSTPEDDHGRKEAMKQIAAIRDRQREPVRPLIQEPKTFDPPYERSVSTPAEGPRAPSAKYGWIAVSAVIGVLVLVSVIISMNKSSVGSQKPGPASAVNFPAPKAESAKVSKPPAPPPLNRRLANGTMIRSGELDGKGRLQVENGLGRDAVAKLVRKGSNHCTAFFYVSSKATHEITGIPDGDYDLCFCAGTDWDEQKQSFTRDKSFSKFRDPTSWSTTREHREDGIYWRYDINQVTLHPVVGGKAKTDRIGEDEFSKLQ